MSQVARGRTAPHWCWRGPVERGAAAPEVYEARYQIVGDSILTLRWIDDVGQDGRFRIALDADTLRLENPAGGHRTTP